MKKIIIINGPNLNLIGIREKEIYGENNFDTFYKNIEKNIEKNIQLSYYQSNVEGEIINKLHNVGFDYYGIILNAGAYTHTSVAISDAIKAIKTPVVEVHISNIYDREKYRQTSLIAKNCVGIITGFGLKSYELALSYFLKPNII